MNQDIPWLEVIFTTSKRVPSIGSFNFNGCRFVFTDGTWIQFQFQWLQGESSHLFIRWLEVTLTTSKRVTFSLTLPKGSQSQNCQGWVIQVQPTHFRKQSQPDGIPSRIQIVVGFQGFGFDSGAKSTILNFGPIFQGIKLDANGEKLNQPMANLTKFLGMTNI